jgi:hypothetical protein
VNKPDYNQIRDIEREVYGEPITEPDLRAFKYNCVHCKTVNWGGKKGMQHAYDCKYKDVQTR